MTKFWKDRKVLVTGAGGFVGSNAVNYLLKKEADVTALISPRSALKPRTTRYLKVDLLNPEEAERGCKGIDTILNFAAVDGGLDFKTRHSAEAFSQNIRIVLNMFDAAVKAKVRNFLLVSTSDIYPSKKRGYLTEKDS